MFFALQIFLTALATILGGALTFALGQIAVREAVEPALELKRLIGTIAFDLDFYGNKDLFEGDTAEAEWRERFRRHACGLREKMNLIVWYSLFERLLRLPSETDILEASRELIFHANRSTRIEEWQKSREPNVKRLLHIKA